MKNIINTLLLSIICSFGFAQKQEVFKQAAFRIDSLPKQGILLDKGWKWHAGDNPDFAKADFDDSAWESIDPTKEVVDLPQIQDGKIGWMRIKLQFDSSLLSQPYVLSIIQVLASEIYADGVLIGKFGKLDSADIRASFSGYPTIKTQLGLPKNNSNVVLSIRFAFQKSLPYNKYAGGPNYCFHATIENINTVVSYTNHIKTMIMFAFSMTGAFFILFIVHFAFFIFFKTQKANLHFSGMALFFGIHTFTWGGFLVFYPIENLELLMYLGIIRIFIYSISYSLLLVAFYSIFNFKKDFVFWLAICINIALIFIGITNYKRGVPISESWTVIINTIASLYITIKAIVVKKKNAKLIFIALACSVLCLTIRIAIDFYGFFPHLKFSFFTNITAFIGFMSIPIGISWFLGSDFAFTSKILQQKLVEVQTLSAEKQQILSAQNETLEKQVEARTAELKASQNQLIQKEKLASLGELTAGIAHEIQNPLNFVNNFSEVSVELANELSEALRQRGIEANTEEGELVSDLIQNQEKIHHHGKRASSIVKGMLEHSRTSTGEKELTDINALADEYLRLAYHGLRAKDGSFNADFKTDFDENLPKIAVIPQDMGRVLLNLINNAFYATKGVKNPLVEIKTESIENGVTVSVNDNGTGMSEATKAKIFQPFFTTKPTGEGTGLGLSLAYDIVTKGHGGTIECESVEGKGTTFIIKLPIQNK